MRTADRLEPSAGEAGAFLWPSRRDRTLVALILAAVVLLLGVAWKWQGRSAQLKWGSLLSAMADGQKAAVETFVGQRLAGAAVFASFPAVRGVASLPESETEEGNHIRSVLEVGRAGWKSRSIAVLGADLRPRVQVGEELPADLGALLSPGRPDASRAGLVGSDGGTRLVVAAAIRGDGAGGPLGWVLLVEDPASILWPILSHDSSASRTGESCLVGRDRGAIVFLSPLRHLRENERPTVTALRTDALAGRQALEGPEAFGEFRDYRGERVLAAVRRIDGPGWGLVVKIDRSEALSGLAGERALHALTLASFGLALFVVLRSFRASERHRAATELQRRDERHRKVLAQVRDAVIWVRPGDGRILEANRASEELWGYSHEELLQKTVAELRPEGEVEEIRTQTVESRSGGVLFFARQRRKDGLVFPVEVSARTVVLDGEDVLVSVVRDVSENEAVLHRIRLLNRLLRTINAVNTILVEGGDRETVLRRTCEEIVATGGYAAAWFAVPAEGGLLVPAASAGRTAGYFDEVTILLADVPLGRGPTGTAFREGRTVVVQDWETDPRMVPWREAGRRRGYRSSAACPVRCTEVTCGVLSLYASEPDAFVPEAALLLEELARDLGLALGFIEAGERRRRAEAALAASEVRYRTLFEDNPAPMWVFDVETLRFLTVNDAAVSLYGYSQEEFLERTIRDIRPGEDVAALEKLLSVPFAGVRKSGPWRHRLKDGSEILVEVASHDVLFEGRSARLVLAHDVTERLRTEEKIRAFFDSGMVGAMFGDVHGNVLSANDEFLRIIGYSRADLEAGRLRWLDLTPPEWLPLDTERIAEAKERGVCTPYEKEYVRKNGTRVPVLVGYALVGEAREESAAFILDLTERKAAEEEIRRLNADLEERVERRTEELVAKTKELEGFAYSVSHDLRAPLRAIDGFSKMIEESHAERLDEEGRRLFGVVCANARRMGRLIDDLLAFSRAGRHDVHRSRVDVGALVRDVLGEVLPEADRARSEVKVGELPPVQADPALLRQVFVNLLSNAVKFSSTRSHRTIEVLGSRDAGRVVYEVVDNGVGFDMRYADKLFGVFQRLHGREFEGTGVGLALVERIVTRLGGTIRAAAELDRGARFTISFPDAGDTA